MQSMTVPQAFMITFILSIFLLCIDWIFALCVQSFAKRNLWNIARIRYTNFRILITTRGSYIFISHGKSNSRICHRWKWWTMESRSFVLCYHIDFSVDFFVVNGRVDFKDAMEEE